MKKGTVHILKSNGLKCCIGSSVRSGKDKMEGNDSNIVTVCRLVVGMV